MLVLETCGVIGDKSRLYSKKIGKEASIRRRGYRGGERKASQSYISKTKRRTYRKRKSERAYFLNEHALIEPIGRIGGRVV